MVDKKFRKALKNYCNDYGLDDLLILDNHAYDKSIIGISNDGRLIYDYESMVREYCHDEKCSEDDAVEWIEYNTERALPYMGDGAPIIINETKDSIIDRY